MHGAARACQTRLAARNPPPPAHVEARLHRLQVKLIGHGRVTNHEGIASAELKHPMHFNFHRDPLPEVPTDAAPAKRTRFYRWHIDAALYGLDPPKVTTLLALTIPDGPRQTVVYDDGTGDELEVSLGTTAFVSGTKALEVLPPELRDLALRTQVRYAPHPYIWLKNARALPTGLGLYTEGREIPKDELPPWTADKVKTFPAVWKNPVTGALSLQLHGCCVDDLIIDGVPVGDLAKTRAIVQSLMRPGIAPRRVYAHEWQPGDLVIFNNWGVWHTVVGTLRPSDVRVYHQCNLAASEAPTGPTAADIAAHAQAARPLDATSAE
jgi:alpha-ketoglutarate-dependent taurine dioxygenase